MDHCDFPKRSGSRFNSENPAEFVSLSEELGTPGGIRTPDLLLRRQPLYPSELQAQSFLQCTLRVWRRSRRRCFNRSFGEKGALRRSTFIDTGDEKRRSQNHPYNEWSWQPLKARRGNLPIS